MRSDFLAIVLHRKVIILVVYVTDPFAFLTFQSYHTTSSARPIALVSERNIKKTTHQALQKQNHIGYIANPSGRDYYFWWVIYSFVLFNVGREGGVPLC